MTCESRQTLIEIMTQLEIVTQEYATAIIALREGRVSEANKCIGRGNAAIAVRNYLVDKLKEPQPT